MVRRKRKTGQQSLPGEKNLRQAVKQRRAEAAFSGQRIADSWNRGIKTLRQARLNVLAIDFSQQSFLAWTRSLAFS